MPHGDEQFRIGVVGVGVIAAALVESLLTGPNASRITVSLSPRSANLTAVLAERFEQTHACRSNQEVLERSDIVILAVRPEHMRDACEALSFRGDHVVVSLAAGWPVSAVVPLVLPATTVCQLIPLPLVRHHVGPVVMQPGVAVVERLLDGCGSVVVIDSEADVITFSCASATMSSFFKLQSTVIDWVAGQGVPIASAKQYVEDLYLGLAHEMTAMSVDDLLDVVTAHETPGGLNEQVRSALDEIGAFREIDEQLSAMRRERLKG